MAASSCAGSRAAGGRARASARSSVIADDNVTGGTQVNKMDPGTLVLGGANTYRGGTAVTGGTLQVSADVTFDQASAGTYAGAMTGSGTLTKTAPAP